MKTVGKLMIELAFKPSMKKGYNTTEIIIIQSNIIILYVIKSK